MKYRVVKKFGMREVGSIFETRHKSIAYMSRIGNGKYAPVVIDVNNTDLLEPIEEEDMRSEEVVYPNDFTSSIRRTIENLEKWRNDNDYAEQRHVAMVLSKLEEAELLSLRMVKEE